MAKQTIYIIGATGSTGSSIVNGLLESGNFSIVAGVRPSSASKPEVNALKSRGVEIRNLDLENWTVDQITETLKGIDTVISAIHFSEIPRQKSLVDACKAAGVKRFIPCDWGTPCIRGLREMHDLKLSIHDYVKEAGIGYTFIDVGWWMQLTLPPSDPSKAPSPVIAKLLMSRYGAGNVKCAVTDLRDIGKFVARIIADDRTLNHYVFCWTQEVTQNEAIALAERVTGRKFDIIDVSADEIARRAKEAQDITVLIDRHTTGYMNSLWVRGDNTVENAKKEEYGGALDARELYPDIGEKLATLEEVAKQFYSS